MNGSWRLRVSLRTSSRTKPNALRRSRPGRGRYFNSAAVNGLFASSPSVAVQPALAAKAISVFGLTGSTLASPRPTAREATTRRMAWRNGLSRHANEPKLPGRLNDRQHAFKRQRLVERIDVALKDRIDRDEIVHAVDFHAVSRVVDNGNVGV